MTNINDKRQLDLDAPLISVRHPTRSALPFYKSDLKSGPVRNPGVVPFFWEQSPGLPKPPRHPEQAQEEDPGDEDDDKFLDAVETLSRSDSCFMNCSVSGMMPERNASASGSFSRDPVVRDFMMERFLPAAKAMATGSLHSSLRKPSLQAKEVIRKFGDIEKRELGFR